MSNYWMQGNPTSSCGSCGSGGCSNNCDDPCDPCEACCGDRVIELNKDPSTGEGEYMVVPGDSRPEFKINTYDNYQVIEDNGNNTYTVCDRDGDNCFIINTRWFDISDNGDNTYNVCANQGNGPCFTIDADYQVIGDNGDNTYTVCDKDGTNCFTIDGDYQIITNNGDNTYTICNHDGTHCFTIDNNDDHTLTNDGNNHITDTHNGVPSSCDVITDSSFTVNNSGNLEVNYNGVPAELDPDLLPNCTCKGPWRMGDVIDFSSCLGGSSMAGSPFTRYNARLELISDPENEFSTNYADISATADQNSDSSAGFGGGLKKHAYCRMVLQSGSRYLLEAVYVERDATETGPTNWEMMGEHHLASVSFGSMFGGSLPSVPTRELSDGEFMHKTIGVKDEREK